MADPVRIEVKEQPDGGSVYFARFCEVTQISSYAAATLIAEIVRKTAERYVEENYSHLVAEIDTKAIANLVIAKCADRIANAVTITPAKG